MAYNDAQLTVMATAAAANVTHVALLTGDPGVNGTANNAAVTRVVPTKTTDADGDTTYVAAFTGAPAGANVWGIGYWNGPGTGVPATGGTYLGRGIRTTGDATVNAAGAVTVTIVETSTSADA